MHDTTADPASVLADVDRLRTQVRSDRRETSVPLLALGGLALTTSWFAPFAGGFVVTAVAVLVLLGLALAYRRREHAVGVGTGSRRWTIAGVAVLVAFVVIPWLAMLFLPPLTIVGTVVAIVGVRGGNRALVAGGLLAAVVSGLEHWRIISNRAWDLAQLTGAGPTSWWVSNSSQLVIGTLAAALLIGGAVALVREQRRG
jgi:hypothetical protein